MIGLVVGDGISRTPTGAVISPSSANHEIELLLMRTWFLARPLALDAARVMGGLMTGASVFPAWLSHAGAGASVAVSSARAAKTGARPPAGRMQLVSVIRFFIVFSFLFICSFSVGAARRFLGATKFQGWRLVAKEPEIRDTY
jgi:hypothetical protein